MASCNRRITAGWFGPPTRASTCRLLTMVSRCSAGSKQNPKSADTSSVSVDVVEPLVLDLNAVIGEARTTLRRIAGGSLETSLDAGLAPIRIDAAYLVHALMTLVANTDRADV